MRAIRKKEVYRSIKLTDNVNTTTLSIVDQIRLLFAKLSNDDVAELDAREKVTADKLKKISALSLFIDKATAKMHDLKKDTVTISLSSEFLPYIDEVIHKDYGKGQFYDFHIHKKDININVDYSFIVVIRKKKA